MTGPDPSVAQLRAAVRIAVADLPPSGLRELLAAADFALVVPLVALVDGLVWVPADVVVIGPGCAR